MHASLKANDAKLRAELEERTEAEEVAQAQLAKLDTEKRLRTRELSDLKKRIDVLERAVADGEEIQASLRAARDTVEGELQTERAKIPGLTSRIAEVCVCVCVHTARSMAGLTSALLTCTAGSVCSPRRGPRGRTAQGGRQRAICGG